MTTISYEKIQRKIWNMIISDANYYDSMCDTKYRTSDEEYDAWFDGVETSDIERLRDAIEDEYYSDYNSWMEEDEDGNRINQNIPFTVSRMWDAMNTYYGILSEVIERRLNKK